MRRIKKGDKVIVISGKFKNASGIILEVLPKKEMVIIEGVNKVKINKKQDRQQENQKEKQTEKEAPIYWSKVALYDEKAKKQGPAKVKYEIDEKTKKKVRISKKSNTTFN